MYPEKKVVTTACIADVGYVYKSNRVIIVNSVVIWSLTENFGAETGPCFIQAQIDFTLTGLFILGIR